MVIYWFNLVLIVILGIFSKAKRFSSYFYFLMFFQLLFLLAFRSPSVGVDIPVYLNYFNDFKLYSFWNFEYSRLEFGYVFLNKVLSFINNSQVFIAIIGAIPLFIFFKVILKESKIPWLSIFLFITLGIYAQMFNVLRQVLAMSIIFISYRYLVRNDFKRFLITVVIASLFHISALIFLVTYLFRNFKIKYKNTILYLIIAVLTYALSKPILNFILSRFSSINYEIKSNGGLSLLIVLIVILIAGLFFSKQVISINPRATVLFNILFLGIIVQTLALEFSIFTRVTAYYYMFAILFIPEVISSIQDFKIRLNAILIVVILTVIQYYISLIQDPNGIVPYIFF